MLRSLLSERYEDAKKKNPLYSLRAFSRRVGLSSSALSEILSGKRRISAKLAERVAMGLGLDAKEATSIVALFQLEDEAGLTQNEIKRVEIETDRYQTVSHWIHFAILHLSETKDFVQDPSWIAGRLSITREEADAAIVRMLRVGLFTVDAEGRWKMSATPLGTSDGVMNLALIKAHQRNLDIARRSFDLDPIEARDFTATTFAIDPDRLPVARKMIREFQDRLSLFLEQGDRREVYKICVQLFPLSRRENHETL